MKFVLLAVLILLFCSGRLKGIVHDDIETDWELVYWNSADGKTIKGDIGLLTKYVLEASDIKIKLGTDPYGQETNSSTFVRTCNDVKVVEIGNNSSKVICRIMDTNSHYSTGNDGIGLLLNGDYGTDGAISFQGYGIMTLYQHETGGKCFRPGHPCEASPVGCWVAWPSGWCSSGSNCVFPTKTDAQWFVRKKDCPYHDPKGKISLFADGCPQGWSQYHFLEATGVKCKDGENCKIGFCVKD